MEKDEVKGKQTWQTEAGYEVLAAEIVHAALDDYLRAKREGHTGTVLAIQNFFRSEWCHLLCGIDGDVLIEAAEKKYETLKNKRKKKAMHKPNKPVSTGEIPVVQMDLEGNILARYKSIAEAGQETGINRDGIGRCARKLSGYKTAGGYRWEYDE